MDTQADMQVSVCVEARKESGFAINRRPDPVPFSTGGVSLYIRAMTPFELARFWQWDKANRMRPEDADAAMFCMSVCDERGNRLFDLEDVTQVTTMDGRTVAAVAARAVELNRF